MTFSNKAMDKTARIAIGAEAELEPSRSPSAWLASGASSSPRQSSDRNKVSLWNGNFLNQIGHSSKQAWLFEIETNAFQS